MYFYLDPLIKLYEPREREREWDGCLNNRTLSRPLGVRPFARLERAHGGLCENEKPNVINSASCYFYFE